VLRRDLKTLFAIDLRSLALFRIAIASLLLVDLVERVQFISINYADDGVLPSGLMGGIWRVLSAHAWHGSVGWQIFLFLLAATAALMLLFGVRTRVATTASWALLVSLHNRNPLLLDGTDTLLRAMLLWSIFLPLGARWSVDARRGGPVRGSVLSPASAVLLLLFVFFYVTCGTAKWSGVWIWEGTAIERVLRETYWARPFGAWMLNHPDLLRVLSPAVVAFEIVGPLLLFVPFATSRIRMVMILAFLVFQTGLALSMQLHLMPWISTAAILPFLPTSFWDTVSGRGGNTIVGIPASPGGQSEASAREIVLLLIVYLAASFLLETVVGKRMFFHYIGESFGLNIIWKMYDRPDVVDQYVIVVTTLRDGSVVPRLDVADDEDWSSIRRTHGTKRFKCYLEKAIESDSFMQVYLEWLVNAWNRRRPEARQIVSAQLLVREIPIMAPGPPRNVPVVSWPTASADGPGH